MTFLALYAMIVIYKFDMTVKIIVLKSGETLIGDIKEVFTSEYDSKPAAYLLKYPCFFESVNGYYITDETLKDKRKIRFHPWPTLSKNENVTIPEDWLVTAVDAIDSIDEIYKKNVLKENVND